MIDVLGPVPSGSREGRVPLACITFRIVNLKEMEAAYSRTVRRAVLRR